MTKPRRLTAEECTVTVDPAAINADVGPGTPEERMRTQARAIEALRRGLAIRSPHFNVAVVGAHGTGRTFVSLALAEEEAARRPAPGDLVLLPNPRGPLEPTATVLPAGRGRKFVRAMEDLHAQLQASWHDVLDGNTRNRLALEVQREQSTAEQKLRQRLSEVAGRYGLALVNGDEGFEFVPLDAEEDVVADDDPPAAVDLNQLGLPGVAPVEDDQAARERRYGEAIVQLTPHVHEAQREFSLLEAHAADELQKRQRTSLRRQLDAAFAGLPPETLATESAREHVRALHRYLIEFYRLTESDSLPLSSTPIDRGLAVPALLTSCDPDGGAPIVHAQNPTLARLFGRVVLGAEDTRYPDPGTILAGDLHRANGGFLVVEAEALVRRERVYEHLKSCLLAGAILPLEEGEGQTLRPRPIPLDVKVILIANPHLLGQLQALDPEFSRLFKMRADFADDMAREDAALVYPRFCAWLAENRKVPPCDATALSTLLAHGARLAEDQDRATTELGRLGDVVTEAAWLANGPVFLSGEHIEAALAAGRERDGLLRERLLDLHEKGTMRVDVTGSLVGQINGLAVVSDGFASAGRPMRVTAVTYAGNDGAFNIDREVELSGPVHDKGVLILAGYLADRFARLDPLAFSASVVFEQSYGVVEGDSASMAELLAILSSLAQLPARQDVAVTGSVDQRGRLLPVGGVNEKIEGFYDLCKSLGFTGAQGVLLPARNARNLLLRRDVRAAIEKNEFHVWTADTVEGAVEAVLGVPAGTGTDEGGVLTFPEGSVYQRVRARIDAMLAHRRARQPGSGLP